MDSGSGGELFAGWSERMQGERDRERVVPTPVSARGDWPLPAAATPPVTVPALEIKPRQELGQRA